MTQTFAREFAGMQRHAGAVKANEDDLRFTQYHQQGWILYRQIGSLLPIRNVGDGKAGGVFRPSPF